MIKKQYTIIIFILFILLNVFDFFNMLPQDIDFFKKLLSWFIIGYLFYSISFTKLFIGTRYRLYDIILLFIYALLTLPKIIIHYISSLPPDATFSFFGPVISLLKLLTPTHMVFLFFASLILIILVSTIIFIKKPIISKSFIGNVPIKNYYLKTATQLFLLYFISLFFGITIFNFFIEWFALAIDSVILVAGLLYYLFIFVKNHTNSSTSQLLWSISNTGNNFYKELIELFSQRSTFFVGIAFLLVIHLLVDIGVYLIPYGIGTENTLYFDSQDIPQNEQQQQREHIPLFNMFDPSKSQFGKDIAELGSINSITNSIFLILSLFLIYLFHFSAYLFLLTLPFLLYYYSVKKKHLSIPPFLLQIFLLCVIFTGIFYFFYTDGFNSPLNIGISEQENIRGVDIYTSQIIKQSYDNFALELISVLLIAITLYGFLNYGVYRYYYYLKKTAYIVILVFFISYIGMYFSSYLSTEATQYGQIFYGNSDKSPESILSSTNYKEKYNITTNNDDTYKAIAFSNTTPGNFASNHGAYLYLEFNSSKPLSFSNTPQFSYTQTNNAGNYIYRGYYTIKDSKYLSDSPSMIIRQREVNTIAKQLLDTSSNTPTNTLSSYATQGNEILETIRYFFLGIFYIFGVLFYSREFIREKILS